MDRQFQGRPRRSQAQLPEAERLPRCAFFRNLVAAKLSYLRGLELHSLSPTACIGLGMVAQIEGELDQSVRRYHEVSFLHGTQGDLPDTTHVSGIGSSTTGSCRYCSAGIGPILSNLHSTVNKGDRLSLRLHTIPSA
jgi:hypothetical protein